MLELGCFFFYDKLPFVTTRHRVAANTAYQLIGKLATMVTTAAVTMIVTRRFGPDGYGDLTLMLAYAALFYIVADFGLNAIVVRTLSGEEEKISYYLGNLVCLRTLISAGLIFLGCVLLIFFPYTSYVKLGILVSLWTILTQAIYTSANAVFQTKLRYDLSVVASVLGSITTLVISLIAIYTGKGILAIASSYVFGGGVMVAFSYLLLKRLDIYFEPHLDFKLWQNIFIAALPLGITTIFSVFLSKADTMILSLLSSRESVGLYGAGYKIFEVALVVPTFFANSVYPVLVRHHKEGIDKVLATTKTSGVFLFLAGLIASVGGIIFAPLAIRVIGGSGFSESILAMRLLFLGMPIFYLSALFLWLLITLGEQNVLPIFYGVGAVFNLLANLIFIPKYGFYASAVITWLSELLILGMLVFRTFVVIKKVKRS